MRKVYLLLVMMCLSVVVSAQTTSTYKFLATTGTFSSISGGTALSGGVLSDDGATTSIPIGFTFNFCGTNYTQLSAGSNGWLSLRNTAVAGSAPTVTASQSRNNTTGNATNVGAGMLSWFWDDMDGSGKSGSYLTSGTAPNRVFTIQFNGWVVFGATAACTVQVKLYETSNIIEYIYSSPTTASAAATIGISNSSSDYFVLNGSGTNPTISSSTFTTGISTWPGNNQVYRFCPAAAAPTVTVAGTPDCTPATFTASGASTYTWASSTGLSATTGATVTATPTSTTTYTVTGIGANGCPNTATAVANLTPNAITGTATVCEGRTTTLASTTGGGTWSSTNTTVATVTSGGVVNGSTAGTTTISYTLGSCAVTRVVTVNATPTVTATPSAATFCGATLVSPAGSPVAITASGASTYTWSASTGLDATTGATVNASPTSTRTYTVTGTAANGCTATATSVITFNYTTSPITPYIAGDDTLCYPGVAPMVQYGTGGTWSTSNPAVITVDPAGIVYGNSAGTATLTYSNATCGTVTLPIVVSGAGITVSVSPTSGSYCSSGSPLALVASGADTFLWSPSLGLDNPNAASVNASPSATTVYTVYGTNNTSGCRNSTTVTVTNTTPAAITGGSTTICQYSTTTWTNASTPGTWSSSNVSVATVTSDGVVGGAAAGTATITFTNTASGCYVTRVVSVTAVPVLTVTPSGTAAACGGVGVTVAASGASTYTWTPSTGLSATTGASVTANPSSATTYTVTGTASGCSSTTTKLVGVGTTVAPYVVSTSYSVCPGASATMTASVAVSATYSVASTTYELSTLTSPSTAFTGDDASQTATIPFTFNYYGSNYTSVNICTNGFINFGTSSTSLTAYSLPTSSAPAGGIFIAPGDRYFASPGAITYSTEGVAPFRRFVVNFSQGANCCTATDLWAGQIILYETSNLIDIMVNYSNLGNNSTIGIQNIAGSSGVTAPDRNLATYTISAATHEAWRFYPYIAAPTYAWSPATDLSATTGTTSVVTPTATRTYTVTMTDPSTGCSGTASRTITRYTPPTVSIAPSVVCSGTPMTASGASTYSWSPATALTATTGATVTPTPTIATTYTVTGTDANGCTGTATKTISFPSVSVSPTTALFCSAGSPVGLSASGTAVSYSWSPAAGLSASTGASVNASPAASTTYTVTGTDASGCTNTATTEITQNTTPSVITGASTTLCLPGSMLLSTDGTGGSWSSSDDGVATVTSGGLVTGVSSGVVTISYSNPSCGFATYVLNVVDGGFTVSLSPTSGTYCSTGSPLAITASGATSYSWLPSSGLSASTGATVNATPSATTTYTVIGTTGGCSNSATITVTNTTPAAITGGITSLCTAGATSTTSWTNTTPGGVWSSSNSSVAAVEDFGVGDIAAVAAGTATITYNVSGCYVTRVVTVNATPALSVSPTTAAACGSSVTLTASGAATYSWAPSTGLSATTGASVSALPSSATTYTITGTSAAGCAATTTKTVTVGTAIYAIASASTYTVCPGGTTTLSSLVSASTGTTYTVVPTTYGLSSMTSPSSAFTGDDSYQTATLPFTFNYYGSNFTSVNICTNGFINFGGATTSLTAYALPSTSAPLGGIFIAPGDRYFASPGAITYSTEGVAPFRRFVVNFNQGANCCSATDLWGGQIILYESTNFVDVMVNYSNLGNNSTIGIQNLDGSAAVTPAGRNLATYTISSATHEAWRFFPVGTASTYAWTPASGIVSSASASTSATVAATTTYTLTVASAAGCTATATTTVNTYTLTPITIAPSIVCSGTPMTASGALSYTWSPATALSATTGATVTPTPTLATTYTVTGTDANGCTNTATKTISFPTVNVSPSSVIFCSAGAPVGLTASGTSTSYTWSPSLGLSSTAGASVNANPTSTTTYTVTGTDASGCSNTATTTVTYNATPTIINGSSTTLCLPGSMALTTNGTGGVWSSTNTSAAVISADGLVTGVGVGTTTISYYNATCGLATYVLNVVDGGFTVSASPTSGTYCSTGSALSMTASGASTYVWLPTSGLSASTGATVSASPTVSTTYTVIGTTGGCSNSATVVVTNTTPDTIAGAVSTICTSGPSATTTWTDATPGGTWSSSDPTVASINSTTGVITGNIPGTATITYNVSGCYVTRVITVSGTPTLTATPTVASACSGVGVTVTASGASTYTWAPSTGLSATTGTSVVANPTSATTYTITGTSIYGCSATLTKTVTLGAAMYASAAATSYTVCPAGTTTLTATSSVSSSTTYTVVPTTYGLSSMTSPSSAFTGDDSYQTATIPFTFNYYGSNYTSVNICTNGFINFGSGSTTLTAYTLPSASAPSGGVFIAPGDRYFSSPGAITYSTEGIAPFRRFVVNFSQGANCCSVADLWGGQIILYETSNFVDVMVNYSNLGNNSTIGIQNLDGSAGVAAPGRNLATYTISSATHEAWRFYPVGTTATYAWTPATGIASSTSASTAASVTGTTVYTVTASNAAGCSASATTTVYNYTPATVTIGPSTVCTGTPMTASGAVSYTWSPATALSATTGATVTPTPTMATTYTVTGTDVNGCTNTATKSISFPTVSVSPTSVIFCSAGSPVGLTASGTSTSYTWSPSLGLSSTAGASVNANPTSTTTYTVTGTDASGCTNTATTTVTYNATPTIISGSSTTLCLPGSMALTTNGTGGVWSSTNTSAAVISADGLVTGVGVGTTTISYYNATCGLATYVLNVVDGGFTVSASPTSGTYCSTGSALSMTASGASTYVWLPTSGLSASTGATVSASPTVSTTYTVIGTTGGCSNSATVVVTNTTPDTIAGAVSIICTSGASATTTWTDATPGGTWSSSAPTVAEINPTTGVITGMSAGTATITYNVGGCYVTRLITVSANPTMSATPETAAACGASVVVTASGATTYTWAPSTGLSATTGATVTANPAATTAYSITGTNAFGCASVLVKTVTVGAPVYAFSTASSYTVCPAGVTTLTATSSIASGTTYTVVPTTYGLSSLSSPSTPFTGDDVFQTATMPFTFNYYGTNYTSVNICTNGFINFGTGTAARFVYTLPNSGAAAGGVFIALGDRYFTTSPSAIRYSTEGVAPFRRFVVDFTQGANCCSAGDLWAGQIILYETSNFIDIMVNYSNLGNASVIGIQNTAATAAVCPAGRNNATYTISAATHEAWRFFPVGSTGTYAWSPATGLSSTTAATPSATVSTPTTYTLTASNAAGCTGTSSVTINNYTLPTVSVAPSVACSGTPMTASGAVSYSWTPATSLSATTGATVTPSPTMAITYTVTGTDANGCSNTATKLVNTLPSVTASASSPAICSGGTTTLTSAGADTYTWSPSTGLSATTGSSVASTLTLTTTYTVVGTDAIGCSNTNTVTVTSNDLPLAYAITGGNGCTSSGVTLGLANSQSGVNYQLYNGAATVGSPVTGTGSAISFGLQSTAGTYSVVATNASTSCTSNMSGTSVISTSPIAYNVTGGSGCSATGITLGVSNSEVGVNYNLYRGASLILTSAGTGSAISYGSTLTVGIWTVVGVGSTGCTTNMIGADTLYQTPSFLVGATPNVCRPATTANLSYSDVVGSPTTYDLTWNSAALATGFTNAPGVSLTPSFVLGLADTAGTYSGTIVVSNAHCSSTAQPFSVNIYNYPVASVTSVTVPCLGYAGNLVFTGTVGASISYTVDGGAPASAVLTGGTYTLSTGAIAESHTYALINANNIACTNIDADTIITITPNAMEWLGTVSSDWNDGSNWKCGFQPTASDDAIIPSGTTYSPELVAAGTGTTRNMTIQSGAAVALNSDAILSVKGSVSNDGQITGSGKVALNGTSSQTITGIGSLNNLELDNTSGASVTGASRMTIRRTLTITSGTLNTNDSVVLASDASATARVAPIVSGGINGQVQLQKYIPGGRRAFRFLSHPFAEAMSLMQWQDGDIDITGTGGATNGFTFTGSNAASAFRYNPTVGNSASSYDPGWRPITNLLSSTSDSNWMQRYQGMRLFVRGSKGEGLSYASYTPSATTLTMKGNLNQGNQVVYMSKGSTSGQDYNLLGNPYASPVDIGTIAYNAKVSGNMAGAAIYVWNPYMATSGIFQAIPVNTVSATPYYLEANGAFEIRAANNGDSLVFTESSKSANVTTSLVKAIPEYVSLMVYDANNKPWDMMYVRFDEGAKDEEESENDAIKLKNPDFSIYSMSTDGKALAIDARPYNADKVIPMGIESKVAQDYVIKAEGVSIPAGASLYLHDKQLNKYVELTQGASYRFTISASTGSGVDTRFELSMRQGSAVAGSVKGLSVSMTPNPASEDVKISFVNGKKESVKVRLLDMNGVSIYNEDMGVRSSGVVTIPLSNYAAGIYMVELTSGSQVVTKRLVKE